NATGTPVIPPTGDITDGTVTYNVYVPNLHEVMFDGAATGVPGGELVLLRPTDAGTTNLWDYAPVDSCDFTGLSLPDTAGTPPINATIWHCVRANDPAASPSAAWHCVYPGRYDGSQTTRRHQGTEEVTW